MTVIQPTIQKAYTLDDVTPVKTFLLHYLFKPFLLALTGTVTLLTLAFLILSQAVRALPVDELPGPSALKSKYNLPSATANLQTSCSTYSACSPTPSCPTGYDLVWISDPIEPGTACNMSGISTAPWWSYQCIPTTTCGEINKTTDNPETSGDKWGPFPFIKLIRMFSRN